MNELSSYAFSPLREGDIALYRGSGNGLAPILLAAAEETSLDCVERLEREYALKGELDADWAARPVALTRYMDRMALVLEDPGGVPLERLLGSPMEVGSFSRLAVGIAAALGKVHQCGLVHKDLKPAHLVVNCIDGQVRLTGFGIASRLPRERQAAGEHLIQRNAERVEVAAGIDRTIHPPGLFGRHIGEGAGDDLGWCA